MSNPAVDDIEDPFIPSQFQDNESICQSLKSPKLLKLTVYGMVVALAFQFPDIVITQIGADYFHDDDDSDNCGNGNAKFAYYSGIFASIGGVIAFCFEGYIGRLSDAFGRKPIMYFTWFCLFSTFCTMAFTNNIWIFLSLSPLSTLTGALGGSPSVMQAAFADSVPCKKNRTIIFGLLFGMGGLVVVIASILTTVLTDKYGTNIAFWIFDVLMILDLLWLIFVVEETLPKEKRCKSKAKYSNPFKIFKEIKRSKILLWFSVIALVTAIPESGLNDILSNYVDEMLDLCNSNNGDTNLTTYNSIFNGTLGVVMLISQLGILPLMSKCMNDTGLLIVGLFTLQIMMFTSGLLYFFPNIGIALCIWGAYGAAFLLSPIVDGALSKRLNDDDQGIGIGIVHGVKGITFAFSPYLFGGLYDLFDNDTWYVITPFIVGAVIAAIGFGVVLIPLRNVMNEYDEKQIQGGKTPIAQFETSVQ